VIYIQMVGAAFAAANGRHEIAIEILLASILFEVYMLNYRADNRNGDK
jgi:hypothetical protein